MLASVATAIKWKCIEMWYNAEKWSVTNLLTTVVIVKHSENRETRGDGHRQLIFLYVRKVESDKAGNGNIFFRNWFFYTLSNNLFFTQTQSLLLPLLPSVSLSIQFIGTTDPQTFKLKLQQSAKQMTNIVLSVGFIKWCGLLPIYMRQQLIEWMIEW